MKNICCIAFSACLLVACGNNKEIKSNEAISVRTATAESFSETNRREFSFISKPYNETELSFRVGGPVIKLDVQPGDSYKKGDIIAEIDNRDFVIRKERSEAVYRQAEAEYNRISSLYEKNNISGSSYEKAKADFAIAKAAYETSTNELNDTRLIAPFDGYIQSVYIEPFQDVKPSQTIISFIELSRLKIEVYIPEELTTILRKDKNFNNSDITINFDAFPGTNFTPSKADISKSTTSNNLSFLLTATLANKSGNLLGGMSGKLSFNLPIASIRESVIIPQSAVCHNKQKGNFVWKINPDNNTVTSVSVKLGNLKDGKIEIIEGVTPGDIVALSQHSFLSDNDSVTIQK